MANAALEIGVVCGRCDTYAPMGAAFCPGCGNDLRLVPGELSAGGPRRQPSVAPAPDPTDEEVTLAYVVPKQSEGRSHDGEIDRVSVPDVRAALSQEELMDQAKNYICESCMTPVPSGHKFCGRCGTPVPDHVLNIQAHFFSDMQDPEKARVVLIRGQDLEGLSYHLKADQHVVGRGGALDFADDPFVSPKHANFFYRGGKLVVRDEGSLNGVYFRIRGSVEVAPGDTFLAGEQLFRLDPTPKASDGADQDGTFFYSSPKYPSAFRLNQVLEGGANGMTVCARGNSLQIGREDGDLNFPGDVFMSAKHCTVEEKDGKFVLTDHDSRNGTYVKIKTEKPLAHGDYVFIGRKLLRVELNTN
jgi:pSer/pThr/pTyr-binding forkhead associated (FHA) protein